MRPFRFIWVSVAQFDVSPAIQATTNGIADANSTPDPRVYMDFGGICRVIRTTIATGNN